MSFAAQHGLFLLLTCCVHLLGATQSFSWTTEVAELALGAFVTPIVLVTAESMIENMKVTHESSGRNTELQAVSSTQCLLRRGSKHISRSDVIPWVALRTLNRPESRSPEPQHIKKKMIGEDHNTSNSDPKHDVQKDCSRLPKRRSVARSGYPATQTTAPPPGPDRL